MMSSNACEKKSTALIGASFILAAGLVLAAFLLGHQTKTIGSGRATVSVKGLAEKAIKADLAEWTITASATRKTFAEALDQLRNERKYLDKFLTDQDIAEEFRRELEESVRPHYVEHEVADRIVQVQDGYTATQTIMIRTQDLALIQRIYKAALDYKASGREIEYKNPLFLVSNLEEIKMSLISAATENASTRAKEFTKHGDSQLGSMRSASQGAFYILPDGSGADSNTEIYGGTYDKTTIDKIARVVVTIEFNLK